MELPDDVLSLVRDFSRPVTRPDWRTLHRMPAWKFHLDVAALLPRYPVVFHFIFNLIFKDQVGFIYKIYCFNGRYLVRSIRDLRTGACYTL